MSKHITLLISYKKNDDFIENRTLNILKSMYYMGIHYPDWQKFEGRITVRRHTKITVYIDVSEDWAAKVFCYLQAHKEIDRIEFKFTKSTVPTLLEIMFIKKLLPKHYKFGDYIKMKGV